MSEIERIRDGICPFTGKRYDCGRCTDFEKLEHTQGPSTLHIGLVFDGLLADGKTGMRELHRIVGGKAKCTLDECADFFWEMYRMGADHLPVGDNCGRFCYRRGCMGHPSGESRK